MASDGRKSYSSRPASAATRWASDWDPSGTWTGDDRSPPPRESHDGNDTPTRQTLGTRTRHPRTPTTTGTPTPTVHNPAAAPTCHHTGPK